MSFYEKNQKYITFLFISLSCYLFMRYILFMVFPFLAGITLVILLNPFLLRLKKHLHIGKGISIGVLLFIIGCGPGFIMFLLAQYLLNNMDRLETYCNSMMCEMNQCFDRCCDFLCKNRYLSKQDINEFSQNIEGFISNKMETEVLPKLMGSSVIIIRWIGIIGAAWAVLVIFSIMLAKDYELIKQRLSKYTFYNHFHRVASKIFNMLMSYFKTQIIMMLIIFSIVAVGLFIFDYKKFLTYALLISFLEMLPFIGTGITLIPMALWQLILGSVWRAIGLILLYIVCVMVREFFEPKLLGNRVGMHPIIMLITIYLGVQLYGLPGIITGPVTFLIIVETYREVVGFSKASTENLPDDEKG